MENFSLYSSHYCSNFRSDARFWIFLHSGLVNNWFENCGNWSPHFSLALNRHYDFDAWAGEFCGWLNENEKVRDSNWTWNLQPAATRFAGLNESVINRWFPLRSMTLGKAKKMHDFRLISFGDAFQTERISATGFRTSHPHHSFHSTRDCSDVQCLLHHMADHSIAQQFLLISERMFSACLSSFDWFLKTKSRQWNKEIGWRELFKQVVTARIYQWIFFTNCFD